MECTGVGQVIAEAIGVIGASGIVCLSGVGHGGAVPVSDLVDKGVGASRART